MRWVLVILQTDHKHRYLFIKTLRAELTKIETVSVVVSLYRVFLAILFSIFLSAPAIAANPGDKLGVFPGFGNTTGVAEFKQFEQWLGRELNFATFNFGRNSPQDMLGAVRAAFEEPGTFHTLSNRVRVAITIGLNFGDVDATTTAGIAQINSDLNATASGVHDAVYAETAQRLIAAGVGSAIIRLGHEPDNKNYAHSFLGGNYAAYKAAFRHVVGVFRNQPGANFLFDYNLHFRIIKDAELGYPGNAYVDIIGFDFYDQNPWHLILKRLKFHRDFAIQKGKPISFPEYGLSLASLDGHGDNTNFINNVHDWITGLPASGPGSLVYFDYFNHANKHNLDHFPTSKKLFRQLYGASLSGGVGGAGSASKAGAITPILQLLLED